MTNLKFKVIYCANPDQSWAFHVVLVHGRNEYVSKREYATYKAAERAGFRVCNTKIED